MTNDSADPSPRQATESKDVKVRLSTLWVFALFNYLYADVVSLMDPVTLRTMTSTGQVGSIQITQGFLLGAAVLMETAIAMVLLSRVLEYRANRWANIVIGALQTAAVISSMFVGGATPALYYLFFAAIEITCTSGIVWYAWRWKPTAALTTSG